MTLKYQNKKTGKIVEILDKESQFLIFFKPINEKWGWRQRSEDKEHFLLTHKQVKLK